MAPNLPTPTPDIQLADVLRHVGDAITVQAPDGSLIFANEAAAELLGYQSPESLVAAPLPELMSRFQLLDGDGSPLPVSELPGRRVLAGERSAEAVVRFRRVGEAIDRWSLVRANRFERDGRLEYVVNAFHDVSAIKQREMQLDLLAQAGELLASSTDYQETLQALARLMVPQLADYCVVDVFDAGGLRRVALAHVDPTKIALAEEIQRRYPPDPSSGVTRVVETGEPLVIPEVSEQMLLDAARDDEHLAALRSLRLCSAIVVPLDARGSSLGALTLIAEQPGRYSDGDLPLLTELARRAGIAVDNARLLHEATEAVRLRDDFLATASHDMRTPLATILGYLQIAQRHVSSVVDAGRLPDFLERAERTTVRLARLVAELMDVSLIRAGQALPLALDDVDLGALVEGSLQEHRALSESHQLVAAPAPEPVIATTDPSRIHRILDNLVGNALKYSEPGTTITVGTGVEGDDALLWVTDHGVGIPADELPRVFERFHRASTSVGSPGVGLGLAGSRDVARQLGGDLTVQSVVGEGSTFTLRIPRTPPAEVEDRVVEA